jgi:hypothetical protein
MTAKHLRHLLMRAENGRYAGLKQLPSIVLVKVVGIGCTTIIDREDRMVKTHG